MSENPSQFHIVTKITGNSHGYHKDSLHNVQLPPKLLETADSSTSMKHSLLLKILLTCIYAHLCVPLSGKFASSMLLFSTFASYIRGRDIFVRFWCMHLSCCSTKFVSIRGWYSAIPPSLVAFYSWVALESMEISLRSLCFNEAVWSLFCSCCPFNDLRASNQDLIRLSW